MHARELVQPAPGPVNRTAPDAPDRTMSAPVAPASMPSETIEAHGHLIDSGDLQGILTTIVEHGAAYEIERFDVGRTNDDVSRLTITVTADTRTSLDHLLEKLSPYGCYVHGTPDALAAAADSTAPRRTTSTPRPTTGPKSTSTAAGSRVGNQRMDAAIVVERRPRRSAASCATCARATRRLRHARRARHARRPVARPADVRLHEQRSLVGAAGRNRRRHASPI